MDRDLLAFLTVAEVENMTLAAERLCISQPTLTKRIQKLEAIYDCQLIRRLPRGVALTKAGERLLPYAKRIKHEYLQGSEDVRSQKSDHIETLQIGAGPLFHMLYLGAAIPRLRSEFPGTDIQVYSGGTRRNLRRLRDSELHIAFGTVEHVADGDQFFFQPLAMVEHGVILRVDHPCAEKSTVHLRELAGLSWIAVNEYQGMIEVIRAQFRAQGLPPPKFALETTSFLLGFQVIANSDYVMSVPIQLKSILDTDQLSVVRTAPPIGRLPAGAYVRRSSLHYPVISRLIDLVGEAVQAQTPLTSLRIAGH